MPIDKNDVSAENSANDEISSGTEAEQDAEITGEKNPQEKDADPKAKDADPKEKAPSPSTNKESAKDKKPKKGLLGILTSALGLDGEEKEGEENTTEKGKGGKGYTLENPDGTPFTGPTGAIGQLMNNFSKVGNDISGTLSEVVGKAMGKDSKNPNEQATEAGKESDKKGFPPEVAAQLEGIAGDLKDHGASADTSSTSENVTAPSLPAAEQGKGGMER
jgi:hypothetical protein